MRSRCIRNVFLPALIGLVCFWGGGLSAFATGDEFGFDDIKFWVGTGENRAAMVIEWDDPKLPKTTLAWGYRWDGEATGEEMAKAIVAADDRLFANFEAWPGSPYGDTVYGLGYDLDNDGFAYVPGTGGELHDSDDNGYAQDPDDLYKEGWEGNPEDQHFWWYCLSKDSGGTWTGSPTGMSSRPLADGVWDGWSFNKYVDNYSELVNNTPPDMANLKAAEPPSPFATAVVESCGPFGKDAYGHPQAVLGKPATHTKDGGGATSRVKMVEPAWIYGLDGEPLITTLGSGSYITVRFDHKVMDDPNNPYGLDFIVFGNSFFNLGGAYVNDDSDMNETLLTGGAWTEKVKVSVSQDGKEWYTYEDGPYGDGLFPTQAHQWDSENRRWTDREMDWTRPVDPDLTLADFKDRTVAEAISMYNGSAGGTGFDLAESEYPWIRYIRVEGGEGAFKGGEIDAFSDVAPVRGDSGGDTGNTHNGNTNNGSGGGGGCFITSASAGVGVPAGACVAMTMLALSLGIGALCWLRRDVH